MLGDFHKSLLVVVSFCLFLPQRQWCRETVSSLDKAHMLQEWFPALLFIWFDFFPHHPFPNLSLMLVRFYELSPVILLSLYEMLYRRHTRKVPQFVMYCCTWIYFYDKYVLLYILYRVQKNPNNYQVLVTVSKVWVQVLISEKILSFTEIRWFVPKFLQCNWASHQSVSQSYRQDLTSHTAF